MAVLLSTFGSKLIGLYRKTRNTRTSLLVAIAVMGLALGISWFGFFAERDILPEGRVYLTNERSGPMTFIEFEYLEPDSNHKNWIKPKRSKLWLAGEAHINFLESWDLSSGKQSQFIMNIPKGWIINLFSQTAKEGLYSQETSKIVTRVFPARTETFLHSLNFGRELTFFKDNQAHVSENNRFRIYTLGFDDILLKLKTKIPDSDEPEVPLSLQLSQNQLHVEVNYLQYLTGLDFEKKLFWPEKGIRILDNKPLVFTTDFGDKNKYLLREKDLSAKRELFTHFYKDPSTNRLGELLEAYQQFGGRLGIPSLASFLWATFQKYPKAVELVVTKGKRYGPDIQVEVYRALQRCSTSLCKIILEQNPYSFNHDLNKDFSGFRWPTIERLDRLTQEGLGEYWSYFYATGDESVLTIIRRLSDSETRRDGKLPAKKLEPDLRQAFKQSLVEHAKEHQKVASFLAKSLKAS